MKTRMPVWRAIIGPTACWLTVGLMPLAPAIGATTAIRLSPSVGPPTTALTVAGRGFDADEVVDLSFDAVLVGTVSANASGGFSKKATVAASALPGPHAITATGETSGGAASAIFTVRTDWTKFHFDAPGTGVNPYENVLSVSNVGSMVNAWTTLTPGYVASSPAVVSGVIYVGVGPDSLSNTYLYAVNAATGVVLWRVEQPSGVFTSDPTLANGLVYIGAEDHILHAYDARTGVERWEFPADGIVDDAVVTGGRLYVATNFFSVYCLNPKTGHQIWKAHIGGAVFALAPAVLGGMVYVGADDAKVYALDATTGEIAWSTPAGQEITSSAAVVNGALYVGSGDHKLYALNAATGGLMWRVSTGSGIDSSPAVWQGTVYVGSGDGNVYAFDAVTGATKWTFPTGEGFAEASPVVANGVVYIGSEDQTMYALDALTGDELWSYQTGGILNDSPAIADGVLYFGSFDHNLYAFQLPSG